MGFADIRTEFVTLIKSVSGIGRVHDFIRHSTFLDELFSRHSKGGKINDWEITRISAAQELISAQGGFANEPCFHNTHNLVVNGYMSVTDELQSEKEFQDLIDAIVLKIQQNNLLNNSILLPKQLQVPIIEHRTFGGVLVHFAQLTFEAIERVGG